MKYNELQPQTRQSTKRVGRGIAAGQGKTAGRGTKGQMSRTGSSKRPGFEGGQNPLMQRLPKLHGFRSFKAKAENVFTDQLNELGATVTNAVLAEKGLVSSEYVRVKLLARGELTAGHARTLITAEDPASLARQIVGGGLSVREAEALSQRDAVQPRKRPASPPAEKDADTRAIEKQLSDQLGLAVTINHSPTGGKLEIRYRTLEQLDSICSRLSIRESF